MERLASLDLDSTSIRELPASIQRLQGLVSLNLKNCKSMVYLPDSICNLLRLEWLTLHGCSKLSKLPEDLWYLKRLDIRGTGRHGYRPEQRFITLGDVAQFRSTAPMIKAMVPNIEQIDVEERQDIVKSSYEEEMRRYVEEMWQQREEMWQQRHLEEMQEMWQQRCRDAATFAEEQQRCLEEMREMWQEMSNKMHRDVWKICRRCGNSNVEMRRRLLKSSSAVWKKCGRCGKRCGISVWKKCGRCGKRCGMKSSIYVWKRCGRCGKRCGISAKSCGISSDVLEEMREMWQEM